jgi:response regulator RpfG family c-di-GMP phosphodiesterase
VDLYSILVVDDEVSNVNALQRALRRGYNVLSATNGEDALAIMEQNDIALIIADHRMPGMTGVELLEKILQKYPNTIRIILTSYTDEGLLMEAINTVHAHGFLAKPWEPEEITSVVGKWIASFLRDQQEKDREIENLQRQLEEARKALTEISQRHDTMMMQLTRRLQQSHREFQQSQRLLEHYQSPWWRRWFGRGRTKEIK